MARVLGKLVPLAQEIFSAGKMHAFLEMLPASVSEDLLREGEADCAWTCSSERYRVNVFRQRGKLAAALRLLPGVLPECEELGLPPALCQLTELTEGLVLLAGATGSGKSTSLAALMQKINRSRAVHIITLEDPIEYEYPPALALIHQREVGRDTRSFARGLRAALREDPDVLLVGELRDSESMGIALTAAETGHLVFATMHTQDVTSAINRILDALPDNPQQIRRQLAECLQAIAAQKLLLRADGSGRVPAFELLLATDAVRHLIREGNTHQLASFMQTGAKSGMCTMQDSMQKLRRAGVIR